MSRSHHNGRGILAMIGSSACFSANDAATKVAAKSIPPTEVMAIRGALTILFVLVIIAIRREFGQLHKIKNPFLLARSGSEASVGLFIIIALSLMPIADVTAILLVQPFLLTIVGVLFLKEVVGWRRWTAVAVGFIGMLLVVKPGTGAFDMASLLVVAAAALVVGRDVATRYIPADVPSTGVVLVTATLGTLIGGSGYFRGTWVVPAAEPLLAAIVSAAFFVGAIILGVLAFRDTDVSVVAPFRYTLVVFAVLYGVFLFREVPDALSVTGIGLIVAAGIYMLHREAARRRQMRADAAATIAAGGPHA
jgi:drug/metabolite transporter (DMT)-like permease